MRLKFFITFAVLGTLMSSVASAQQTAKITSANTAYLEYLPQGYSTNSNLYPLVISLHGIKEKGTTSTDPALLKSSVATVANVGLPKYVKYGAQYPFILVSPQLKSSMGSWPAAYVLEVINYAKKNLRVDPNRVYITGLSLGGLGVWTTLGAYPEVFAGAIPICAGGNALSSACKIAAQNVPVWGFHGDADNIVSYTVTTKMVAAINACTPKPSPLAKATLFAGANHIIWDNVYNKTNALDWMLSFTNGTVSSSNLPPLVDAGVDVVASLPTNVALCNGSASDPDGAVTAYSWSQVSGPSTATLENKTTKSLKASNLLAGTYTFRLKAVDDKGAYANDDVKVIINSTTNTAPAVSAGADKTITLPTNSLDIQGTASDSDGIASYQWTKVSGGTASLSGQTTSKVRAYNLVAGTYVFRLTVKDTKGAAKYDDVQVTVSNSNPAPTVSAGADKTITLPTNSLDIQGTASDSDGIASYQWTKVAGGTASLSGQTTSKLRAYNLVAGTYVFRLTVKDTKGVAKYDDVQVNVTNSNTAPTVSAGADKTITLPTNSLDIQGTASDSDGIASYQWTKVSGSTASLSGQTTSKVRAYNLVAGTYVFRLTVKDTKGAAKYDDVKVTVSSGSTSTTNLAPIANAGSDKTLTLPTNSVKLYGSGNDSDGTIASYKWTQYGGPAAATITNGSTAAATFSNLKAGSYYFRLTVKDNSGASDYDNVLVKVVSGVVSVISLESSMDNMLALAD